MKKETTQLDKPLDQAQIDRELTTALAHRLWVSRGSPDGSPEQDWYRAERLLRRHEEAQPQAA